MILEQFHLESLGHASYLLGSEETGEAMVVDPRRDVHPYLEAARRHGLRITRVTDTHGHNDYLSGLTELVARTGARALGSAHDAGLGYPHDPIKDGERVTLGEMEVEALHTPGHTPEHLSFLVRDRTVADEPALLLSGGALLVGDLARPDLLGGPEETARAARAFCQTLREKILALPDHVQVLPTHVAGSLCGGHIGSRLSTTVGYERRTNPVLARLDRAAETPDDCLDLRDLPAVPPYWRRMRRQNLAGVSLLGRLPEPPALDLEGFEAARREGVVVLDTRSPEAFAGGHVPTALSVAYSSSFPTWAGTVLDEGARTVLVLDRPEDLRGVTWELLRIGYPSPEGWLAGGMHAWRTSGRPVATLPQLDARTAAARLERDELSLLDVRQPAEWADGHAPGAVFVTGGELPDRLQEVPDGPVAVTCGSAFRSTVLASYLLHRGRTQVVNLVGGMEAWEAAGLPVEE